MYRPNLFFTFIASCRFEIYFPDFLPPFKFHKTLSPSNREKIKIRIDTEYYVFRSRIKPILVTQYFLLIAIHYEYFQHMMGCLSVLDPRFAELFKKWKVYAFIHPRFNSTTLFFKLSACELLANSRWNLHRLTFGSKLHHSPAQPSPHAPGVPPFLLCPIMISGGGSTTTGSLKQIIYCGREGDNSSASKYSFTLFFNFPLIFPLVWCMIMSLPSWYGTFFFSHTI